MAIHNPLGQFYFGKEYDLENGKVLENRIDYDAKDLCTHAVCVGMTGSGKTGLCLSLLEEAALDGIPAICIDPKGDLGNLLLSFPGLTADEFRPWIDKGEATRKGMEVDEFAQSTADAWKKGLNQWGYGPEYVQAYKDSVDIAIYTPASNAGLPLTVLKSFDAPNESVRNDGEAFRDKVNSTVSGLLALMQIEADPISSREHILLSNILSNAWNAGKNLDMGNLIREIQAPPFDKVGFMDLEAFYPAKERFKLSMQLNNLLASPGFAAWMEGEPLDIQRMYFTPEGKPRISIISIAHLSDAERMFFVTILLNEILSWTRTQAGTSSLRAILYMDEVYGYFPPTANPPSKRPMLTLLKQARAFGLGCVLATQNPVDLDYKGLSNAGTWFLGRLQTERDKARVIEGLEGASSQAGTSFDKAAMERTLAGLGNRVFLMNNVHEDHPVVFETRWAMSYLRGPLTRDQLQTITESDPNYDLQAVESANKVRPGAAAEAAQPVVAQVNQQELVPSGVDQFFVAANARVGDGQRLVYRPMLIGEGRLHYVRAGYKVDKWMERRFLASVSGGEMPDEIWDDADPLVEALEMDRRPEEDAEFAELPVDLQKAKNYKTWQKELKEFLYRKQSLTVYKCTELKKYSEPGEELGDFKVRMEQAVSEKRDEAKEKLTKKYASKFSTLQDRIRRAEDKVEVQEEQYSASRSAGMWAIGTTVMGALLGRKTLSVTNARRAGSSMRALGRSGKEKSDIARAKDGLEDVMRKYEDLEEQFNQDVDDLTEKLSVDNMEFEELSLPPRKSDISIEDFGVCWMPFVVDSSGIADPAY